MQETQTTAQSSELPEIDRPTKLKAELFNAMFGRLDERDGYSCALCRNRGVIAYPEITEFGYSSVVFRECVCMKPRRSLRRLEKSGLKNLIKDYTFARFNVYKPWQELMYNAAKLYAEKPEGWFFVGGQSGSGKTHICTAICREFLLNGRAVIYMLWRDAVTQLKAAVTDEKRYAELINEYKTADVLYVDDLFKCGRSKDAAAQPTSGDINVAFEILNYRYNDPALITIISSEYSIGDIIDIDESVGSKIYQRTKDGSNGYSINIKRDRDKNYRLRSAAEPRKEQQ